MGSQIKTNELLGDHRQETVSDEKPAAGPWEQEAQHSPCTLTWDGPGCPPGQRRLLCLMRLSPRAESCTQGAIWHI